MKAKNGLYTGHNESANVDKYMNDLDHPMKDCLDYLRQFILSVDKNIDEGIYWNAPVFYYMGSMAEFDPKEYKRYIIGANLFKKDCLRMIFLTGSKLTDKTGILEGDYKDGRRLLSFANIEEVKQKEKAIKVLIKEWIKLVD